MERSLLEMRGEIISFFSTSDIITDGIIKSLEEYEEGIPEDYTIVGFDNLIISRYSLPILTIVS